MSKDKTVIIGAGPAGLGMAYHLEGDFTLFERESRVGGLMRTKEVDGFSFDYAGHIFFTRIGYIKNLIKKLLKNNMLVHDRQSWIYSHRTYTRYPFQANTYGLPSHVVKDSLVGFIKAVYENHKKPPKNFKEWISSITFP